MAFRASNSLPDVGLDRAKKLALQLKAYVQARSAQLLSATTNADVVLAILSDLVRYKAEFQAIANIPGIVQYARDLENDVNYNVVTEFTALTGAIDLTINDIITGFPKDGNGYLLEKQVTVAGVYVFRTFAPAATATLRTRLDAISALIT